MSFQPGQPRPLNAGRKAGTPNRRTALASAALDRAIKMAEEGGMHPFQMLVEASRLLRGIAASKARSMLDANGAPDLTKYNDKDLELVRKFMVDASAIAYKACEFVLPKQTRVDVSGQLDHTHQAFDLTGLADDELAQFERLARKAAIAAGDVAGDLGGESTSQH